MIEMEQGEKSKRKWRGKRIKGASHMQTGFAQHYYLAMPCPGSAVCSVFCYAPFLTPFPEEKVSLLYACMCGDLSAKRLKQDNEVCVSGASTLENADCVYITQASMPV